MAKKRIAVIGLGRFGSAFCRAAQKTGFEIMAMDSDQKRVNAIADDVAEAIIADSTDPKVTASIDWRQFFAVVVAIGTDLQSSLVTILNLKEAGVETIWCKTRDNYHYKLALKMGVTRAINPEQAMGEMAASWMDHPELLTRQPLSTGQVMAELEVNATHLEHNLAGLLGRHHIRLLGITRYNSYQSEQLIQISRLQPGDKLLLLAEKERLEACLHNLS
ncbi:TrkA family potassium uptake protein [Oceanimonas baumannii]|uniref:potassium channel family protein n=1 Tax=Oceanimonas baumannii TaxID=129578 RepID=UPI001D192FF5|nr:TrkA family potassium uptake protein [Oceanimonas baumannii]MCC4265142.1 TrkA family potassium uptake protein [Oceanimonas baumannii]